ncbi:MAG: tetratricopeptide repeat protein [Acidiferrobacteraceae bacterium]
MNDIEVDLASGIAAFEAKNFARASQLLSPLADLGNPEAQFRMAIMAQIGLGMVSNCAKAVAWMQAAAEQNFALAQHGLGFMYLQGECTKHDPLEAARWFRLAADQGLEGSRATLAMMYEQGLGVERNEAEARRLRGGTEGAV